jgi:hypothetical protein
VRYIDGVVEYFVLSLFVGIIVECQYQHRMIRSIAIRVSGGMSHSVEMDRKDSVRVAS